jgi:two-component system cell cycle sensor histidine kinase/response regulator CckA
MGSAELLRLKAGKEDLPYIDNIIKSSERMAELVSHLLAFTGQTIQQPKNINVNDSIMAGLNMAQKGRFQDTTVRLDLYDDLWPVFADATLIQQMMINLIINAFEAIEGRDGSVSIKTSNIDIKSPIECSPLNQVLPEGEYIKIEVSDTGHGIPKEVQRRVFEPFFTTRFLGRGLGLAAVAGIVKSHNGCISLESEEGKGTTFTIYLPRSKESEIERKTRRAGEKKGRGILVVDDEETILNLIRETLSGRGYEVYCSKDGIEALETFRKNGDKIGLAILDIEMPGMDGRKLISELRSLSEDIKIIVSSGYDEETALMGVKPAPEGFIQKPYRLSVLLEKVKEVFSEAGLRP